jgi:enoyl-CoA hydratase/carnithine racemase
MADDPVRLDIEDGVATATLNQPDRRNALSNELMAGLESALESVRDSDARCLVITGAGGAFSAGGDIDRMQERVEIDMPVDDAVRSIERRTASVIGQVYAFPLPTVAKIDGPAVGAGAGLALACDLQLASEDASMGFVFRHVGLTADAGVSYLLPRLVGANVAKELLLTGEILDADRALELGLLNHVYPSDGFDDHVDELVETIAAGPTVALRHATRLVDAAAGRDFEAALRDEAAAQGLALGTEDHREGVEAFIDGREPTFEGR